MIAVIAILAALLLPALSRSQQKVHAAVCLSNQRQINLDFRLHLDDPSQRLDQEDFGLWAVYHLHEQSGERGPAKRCWICPSAPPGTDYPSTGGFGTVRSAWCSSPTQGDFGSYGVNWWLIMAGWHRVLYPGKEVLLLPEAFRTQGEIVQPAFTPVLADAVFLWPAPRARDEPPRNLVTPAGAAGSGEMHLFTIPRHGSRPNRVPTNWPRNMPLPGAVNVSFFDGHGELVKLDRLWQLYWHRDYQPPAKRPGLP